MIAARLGRALDWRLRAVTDRLDAVRSSALAIEERVQSIEQRLAQLDARLTTAAETMTALGAEAAEARERVEGRLEPALRAVLDGETANRRSLYALREHPDYERAFSDPSPLVSIAVATVGRGDLSARSLPSLLAQTYENIEVIVVGDAVTDDVREAVESLADSRVTFANLTQRIVAHQDPRRHWLVGSTMARNEAARRARGRWLVHFDDDDRLRPDAIASLLELARERRAEVAYGGYEEHLPERASSVHLGFPPRQGCFSWGCAIGHAGLSYFERELFAAHLGVPGDMYALERMLRAGVRFALLEQVVLDYFPSSVWT